MTEEQIDNLNASINIIRQVCNMYEYCIDCPMLCNCTVRCPNRWKEVKKNEDIIK